MATVIEREIVEDFDRPSQIGWGAVLAGLMFMVSASWLLFLLGSAIGVGIADATDAAAIGDGLGIGAIVWLLVTSLIVFFIGALLAARLSGKADKMSGMLHGLTVWSVGTALTVVLGYFGVAGLIQTGQSVVQGAANAAMAMGSGATSVVGNAAEGVINSPLMADVQAKLKKSASKAVAGSAGAGVDGKEVSAAVENISGATLQTATGQLITGDVDAARKTLADETTLTEEQINSIVDGVAEDAKDLIAKAGEGGSDAQREPTLFSDIQDRFSTAASQFIANADTPGGAEVDKKDISRAIAQLTPQTLGAVAMQLIQGNVESAKDELVVNTDLSEAQINAVVDGVSVEVQQQVEELKVEVDQKIEAASTYAQAVLWTAFVSSALGMIVALFGGALGADTLSRIQLARTRVATAI